MSQILESIRPMTRDDLKMVLAWRNHVDVRQYMYTKHEISLEEHLQWFELVSRDDQRHLLIYEHNLLPLGFINIKKIAPGGIANWGFYAAPGVPKGVGAELGNSALRYAFVNLGLHKVCGQVLVSNGKSIRFHLKLGFLEEGILRQHHFDGQSYQDVLNFGLLAQQWRNKSSGI